MKTNRKLRETLLNINWNFFYVPMQNQFLEGCLTIISIKRPFNKRDISWLFIFPNLIKGRGNVIDSVEEDIPVLIIRLFPKKHEIDADGEWNSPVCILTFNLQLCLEEWQVGSNTIDCFPQSYFLMFWLLSLLVKSI